MHERGKNTSTLKKNGRFKTTNKPIIPNIPRRNKRPKQQKNSRTGRKKGGFGDKIVLKKRQS